MGVIPTQRRNAKTGQLGLKPKFSTRQQTKHNKRYQWRTTKFLRRSKGASGIPNHCTRRNAVLFPLPRLGQTRHDEAGGLPPGQHSAVAVQAASFRPAGASQCLLHPGKGERRGTQALSKRPRVLPATSCGVTHLPERAKNTETYQHVNNPKSLRSTLSSGTKPPRF